MALVALAGCSGDPDTTENDWTNGTGGTPSGSGGEWATGGDAATGGASNAPTGGAVSSGGGASGGAGNGPSTGGAAGGVGSGGVFSGDGGAPATGGASASGGNENGGCGAQGFHVSGGKLLDVNCNDFVMRGANVPHAWFTGNTQQAFSDLAAVGGNAVRVVMGTGGQWTRTSGSELSNIISWAKANQLVAVLEVHDATGSGESEGAVHPDAAVEYWQSSDIVQAISGEEAYVLINIANEPFGNSMNLEQDASTWKNFHVAAVQALRTAGLKHTFVVDAPNWGQDWQNIMSQGSEKQDIFDADPDKNVVFSVHMYDIYSSAAVVTKYLDDFLASGLPLIVGEFAADHGAGKNVDEATIMAQAQMRGIGYLGWSWSGNGMGLESLDMTNDFNVNSPTSWGMTLFDGPNGLGETGQVCSCFL